VRGAEVVDLTGSVLPGQEVEVTEDGLRTPLRAWEIRTLRVRIDG